MARAKKRAFLVEDEPLILMMLERMMESLGYEIAGKALTLANGLATLEGGAEFDVAVLDVNLDGARSFPIADRLRAAGVPVLFSTGYGQRGIVDGYADWPVIEKPYSEPDLEKALSDLPDRAAG